MKATCVRFSDLEHQQLQELSKQTERSMNNIIRDAVRAYLVNSGVSNFTRVPSGSLSPQSDRT
ncbi:MAG: ribbon-helix-helix protein, CopG family [Cyanobacteriota bacterium]|nr:ribbon-helix-helix protein, CopG family [Cyanobacteriota bacterium]